MGRKPGSAQRPCWHPHSSPPRIRYAFLSVVLHAIIASWPVQRARAQADHGVLQLSSAFEAFECQNMSIAWQGGVPAYSLVVVSDHVEEFSGISGTSFQWLADAPVGTTVFVSLVDSTGAHTDSPVFNVTNGPGSSDACLPRASSTTIVSSSSSTISAMPSTSVRETPSVLSFGASTSHLPSGAVAAIVVEAAVLTLSVAGLLIIFFLDRKDRTREQSRAGPPVVDLLESPRPPSQNIFPYPGESRPESTTAASSSPPHPAAKELPLRTGTVRRGPSPTIQSAANAGARQSFTPSEATFVGVGVGAGISGSPAASIRGSPSSSVRFAQGTDEKPPRKKRRTPLQQALLDVPPGTGAGAGAGMGTNPPSAFPAERMQSVPGDRGRASDASWPRDLDATGAGRGVVGGVSDASDLDGGGEQEKDGEPPLLTARFEA
ncbi:hypothetical protein GSI_08679 [Ganoderma sinense ZZ0214-1]|uniref:Uncharacterized protein n=1 Tax=Ganoderma sinense ZZ0214-1 TaxID=1077348 RepID=A0A2G8S4I3_9APHY|nr:hypothetical protein GSI_08679 [Ganoderma sinense ZZ0214-1]